MGCASGSGGGTVDDIVGESDDRDARESSPQPGMKGWKETGRKEIGPKEMGGKMTGGKETFNSYVGKMLDLWGCFVLFGSKHCLN